MEIIKVENITFTYPDKDIPAIKNVSFTIKNGEFITLCGKSGSGKSTLLSLLKKETAPFGDFLGKIHIKGKQTTDFSKAELAKTVGFVGQNPENQIVTDKVWHELAFGLENLGLSNDEIRAKVSETASFFGIEKWFYNDVSTLSGGQKQLLNLASVMVMQPEILLLDEPTSRLDPISAGRFFDTIKRINKEFSTTVILCEHSLEEAFALSDKVLVLEEGEVLSFGTPKESGDALFKINADISHALPTAMRVYYNVENEKNYPITVKDGKNWLLKYAESHTLKKEAKTKAIKENNNEIAISAKNLWFRYEKNQPDCLKDVSFSVKKGEFYAILGGNGSGKTTLLSVLSGQNKAYHGKIENKNSSKIGYLPQNPQTLFVKNTVEEELFDCFSESNLSIDEKNKAVLDVIRLCKLQNLLSSHPFDISGGEQQRLALAKVLLFSPQILLFDEPTKGMDTHFKIKFANIIKKLTSANKTIIMVSHDIEFCAKYADRCALFFDGSITSEGFPNEFFSQKSFYTTAANRMARGIIENAVLDEDIIDACGGLVADFADDDDEYNNDVIFKETEPKKAEKEKFKFKKNHLFGIIFLFLFFLADFFTKNVHAIYANYALQFAEIIFISLSLVCFFPKKRGEGCKIYTPKKKKQPKTIFFLFFWFVLLIPLTVFLGVSFLGNRKYYFISMLVIAEVFLPFIFLFEKKKPKLSELITVSVLCALAISGRAVFYMLPQFKPILAIVIIAGVCFGAETGFFTGSMCAFISNFFFGQGPWTPWQMICFGIIGFLAGVLFERGFIKTNIFNLCFLGIICAIFIYGAVMNCASVLMYQTDITFSMLKASVLSGFPFDVIHAVSTAFFIWFGGEMLIEKLERVKRKYGIFN